MAATYVDIAALLPEPGEDAQRVLWSATGQLQTNLVSLPAGARVEQHVEGELDVLLVVVQGAGVLTVLTAASQTGAEAVDLDVAAPAAVLLTAGTARAITAGPAGLAYVTAHRRRPGLLPSVRASLPAG
jgi:hypothetical protein